MVQQLDRHRKSLLSAPVPPGTVVMAIDPHKSTKWEPKYIGPYVVLRRARNGAYVLRDAGGDILDRHVPIDKLKVVKTKLKQLDDVYEVESVLEHRGLPGDYEYRVKWKGYDEPTDETWEHQSQFFDDRPIQRYWSTQSSVHGQ